MIDGLQLLRAVPRFFERRPTSYLAGDKAINFETYAELPAVNASLLKEPTPAHMLHRMTKPREATPALEMGTLFHAAVLEPETFPCLYVLLPDDAPKKPSARQRAAKRPSKETEDAIAFWDEFNARASGRIIATTETIDTVEQMRDAVFKHHFARTLVTEPGRNEATIEVWDDNMQVMRKARYDRLPGAGAEFLFDLKTTHRELNPWAILGEVRSRGYHLQAKFYVDTLNLAANDRRGIFYLIFVRNEAPFLCRVFELNASLPGNNLLADAESLLYATDNTQPGRLPMFCNAALEFLRRIEEGHVEPLGAWEGFENEPAQLLLP